MPDFMSAASKSDELEHKALAPEGGSALLNADEATGVVEALVSVTGVPDEVNDIILPGAYKDTLAKRRPKVIFGHDWQKWVARTEEVKELMPGDPALPKTTRNGSPWPAAAGALYLKAKFNLDTPEGKSTFSNVRFFSETGECEWSIGFKVPPGKSVRTKSGQREIRVMDLFEASPVLFGAAPLSGTLTVKSAVASPDFEAKAADDDPVTDWTTDSPGDDPQDPITAEADEDDPDMAALHADAIREMNDSPEHWIAVDAASMIDPGEEETVSSESKSADGSMKVSDKPWSGFSQADYTPQQWHQAALVHAHPVGASGDDLSKDDCKLPVREPDGTLNRNAVHAAAGRLGQVDASPAQKLSAAGHLKGLYKQMGETPPDSLQAKGIHGEDVDEKTAGQDVTPADMKATERLKSWYVHGGGAAQIGWGKPGDFNACVAIAGKHMDPAKAKGYCQLRHKDATGFYACHAPSEQAAHGAAAAVAGKKGVIDPATLSGAMPDYDKGGTLPSAWTEVTSGADEIVLPPDAFRDLAGKSAAYDPSLEQGEYAGNLPAEFKSAIASPPIEEHLDRVAEAVTTALGGGTPGDDGMPRRIVALGGTWDDHAIALAFDSWGTPDDGETYRVPYAVGDDGSITPGTPEPVTLTLGGDGEKSAAGASLSALPVLVEHVTAFISRGLRTEVKQGQVLSASNAKLLQGAVNQLITVLGNAGIEVGVKENQAPDDGQRALDEATSEPLYMPDSTAPAAQVPMQKTADPGEGKVLLDPALVASGYAIIADAAGLAGR